MEETGNRLKNKTTIQQKKRPKLTKTINFTWIMGSRRDIVYW